MLLSHRHKFIYTKTVKTGGTSVESFFEPFCMRDGEWEQLHLRNTYESEAGIIGHRGGNRPADCRYWNHMPAELIRDTVGAPVWDAYFKFCVVRNPYDKAVSAFYFMDRTVSPGEPNIDSERERFEHWLLTSGQCPIDRDKYMIGDTIAVDDFIRYENLDAETHRICRRLNLEWKPQRIPKFKAGIRPAFAKTHLLYTPKARAFVENAYAFEFDYFKYAFPAPAAV